jgi:hypothetical protein
VTCDQRRFTGVFNGDEMLEEQRVFHDDQFIIRILGEDGHVAQMSAHRWPMQVSFM